MALIVRMREATGIPEDAMERAPMHIAVAADRLFLMPLAATLASLAQTHRRAEVAVWVLHEGLRASDREKVLRGLEGRLDVRWLHVAAEDLDDVHHTTCLTKATLYRLLLPDLLPRELERLIYLDADTVVGGSLRPLWETDLGGLSVGAVRDAGSPFSAGPNGTDWRKLQLEPGDPYFNAGVLLIDLESWRATGVSPRAVGLLRETALRWGDQDALNATLRGNWLELPRRWNLQTPDAQGEGLAWALWRDDVERALTEAVVIHYTDRVKPWHAESRHPRRIDWYEALDRTAWTGWRAVPASRPLYRRVVSRAKRAWKVLIAPPTGQRTA